MPPKANTLFSLSPADQAIRATLLTNIQNAILEIDQFVLRQQQPLPDNVSALLQTERESLEQISTNLRELSEHGTQNSLQVLDNKTTEIQRIVAEIRQIVESQVVELVSKCNLGPSA
jgi:hypothetical protein